MEAKNKDELMNLVRAWDSSKNVEDQIDKLLFVVNGNVRTRIRISFVDQTDFAVGKKYWYVKCEMFDSTRELLTITHIRGDVVFFTSDQREGEDWFPLGSLMAARMEPEVYVTDKNPKYYEFVSFSDKVKIIYQ